RRLLRRLLVHPGRLHGRCEKAPRGPSALRGPWRLDRGRGGPADARQRGVATAASATRGPVHRGWASVVPLHAPRPPDFRPVRIEVRGATVAAEVDRPALDLAVGAPLSDMEGDPAHRAEGVAVDLCPGLHDHALLVAVEALPAACLAPAEGLAHG